jgi:hypothetical protein
MHPEMRIDHLIKEASGFNDNDSGRDMRRRFSKQVLDCLTDVVGSDHPYTKMVEDATCKGGKNSLSTACGVLWATKMQLDNERHAGGRGKRSASGWRNLSGYLS